jgi:AraC-like DNA-binding protein
MSWTFKISPHVHLVWHGLWKPGTIEMKRKLYDHELVVVARGKCRITVGRENFTCAAGSYIVIPPDRMHETIADSNEEVYRYCVHFDWIYQGSVSTRPLYVFLPGPFQPGAVHRPPAFVPRKVLYGRMGNQAKVISLLETLAFNWKLRHGREMVCRAWLLEILLMLLSAETQGKMPNSREHYLALRVKDMLDQSVFENEIVKRRLEQLEYSYAHLSRVFKKHFSLNMVSYLNRVRLENAKLLLASRKYRISEVAYKLGYNTPRYFSRLFKNHTGMTPQQFIDV